MAKTPSLRVKVIPDTRPLKKGLARATGQVKMFGQSIRGVAASMGLLFGGAAVLRGIGTSINKIADFEEQMDKVQAISRASASEVKKLSQNALDLGAKSKFTATQIGKMQEEMARLGVSSGNILKTTDSVRKLATAIGEDLAPSAETLVKTMNAFGLQASDADRIANVMAESFAGSALKLERFDVAMGNVGATARAAGFSLEQTTAMLGILVDSGIDASKAGTDLRKIFTEIAVNGLTLEDALNKIVAAENKVTSSFDQFGQRAQTSAIILAENQGRMEDFTASLSDANTELDKMAEILEDNLNTDLGKLNSAWDALIQKGSALNNVGRGFVQWLTDAINTASGNTPLDKRVNLLKTAMAELNVEMDHFEMIDFRSGVGPGLSKGQDIINKYHELLELRKGEDDFDAKREASLKVQEEELRKQKGLRLQINEEDLKWRKKGLKLARESTAVDEELPEMPFFDVDSQGNIKTTSLLLNAVSEDLNVMSEAMMKVNNEVNLPHLEIMKENLVDLGAAMESFTESTLSDFAEGLAEALVMGDPGALGKEILSRMSDFMAQLGEQLIAAGIASEAFKKLAVTGLPAIAAGIALIAAAGAVKATLSSTSSGFSGTGSEGDRTRTTGSVVGLNNQNKEVKVGGEVRISGNDLIMVLNNANYNNGRTGGQVLGG